MWASQSSIECDSQLHHRTSIIYQTYCLAEPQSSSFALRTQLSDAYWFRGGYSLQHAPYEVVHQYECYCHRDRLPAVIIRRCGPRLLATVLRLHRPPSFNDAKAVHVGSNCVLSILLLPPCTTCSIIITVPSSSCFCLTSTFVEASSEGCPFLPLCHYRSPGTACHSR